MSKGKLLIINMSAGILSMLISMSVSFFLSPYIVRTVGTEAFGFVQLSTNILSYFTIVTIALNSMSSRYISIAYFSDDIQSAKEYFSSNFFANVVLCMIYIPILSIFISNISRFLRISPALISDVRLLMVFLCLSFLISMLCNSLKVSYYVKNKLYISSLVEIGGHLVRAIMLIFLFSFFPPNIAFISLTTLVIGLFTNTMHIYFKQKLIPDLHLRKAFFQLSKVKQLLLSGLWNSVSQVGAILQSGVDLLLTNLMVSPADMGIMAIVKTIPTLTNNLLVAMIAAFFPDMTQQYATGQNAALAFNVKRAIRITGFFITVPVALAMGFGKTLFSCWFPTQDPQLLQSLSFITLMPWLVVGPTSVLYQLFTILNRVKPNSFVMLGKGLLQVLLVYILLRTTTLGISAIVWTSSVLSILQIVLYSLPFCAKYIDQKWFVFFPDTFRGLLGGLVSCVLAFLFNSSIVNPSWLMLFVFGGIAGLLGLGINAFLVLTKGDRQVVLRVLRKKLTGNREHT